MMERKRIFSFSFSLTKSYFLLFTKFSVSSFMFGEFLELLFYLSANC